MDLLSFKGRNWKRGKLHQIFCSNIRQIFNFISMKGQLQNEVSAFGSSKAKATINMCSLAQRWSTIDGKDASNLTHLITHTPS